MRRGHGLVHLVDHRLILVRASNGEHVGVAGTDSIRLNAEAAGDNHAAVLTERLPDRLERFLLGGVQKAAGVDDDCVGAFVARRKLVTLGAELGDDAFRIDQRLWTTQADETDFRRCGWHGALIGEVPAAVDGMFLCSDAALFVRYFADYTRETISGPRR